MPDVPSDTAGRGSLPRPLTSFIGRERELAQAKRLLAGRSLVTLTGPGGSGKTRLCIALAAEVAEEYPDGVYFVPLAPVRDPVLVPSTIAQGIGLQDARDRPLLDTYGTERRPVAEEVIKLTHTLVRYGTMSHPIKRRIRDIVVPALSRTAVIQRRAASRLSQVYVAYPPGPLVIPDHVPRDPDHPQRAEPGKAVIPCCGCALWCPSVSWCARTGELPSCGEDPVHHDAHFSPRSPDLPRWVAVRSYV